jgi:hypothetical protein
MEKLKGLSASTGTWQIMRGPVQPPHGPSQTPDFVALRDSCGLKWHQSVRRWPYLLSCCFNAWCRTHCGPNRWWIAKVKLDKSEGEIEEWVGYRFLTSHSIFPAEYKSLKSGTFHSPNFSIISNSLPPKEDYRIN